MSTGQESHEMALMLEAIQEAGWTTSPDDREVVAAQYARLTAAPPKREESSKYPLLSIDSRVRARYSAPPKGEVVCGTSVFDCRQIHYRTTVEPETDVVQAIARIFGERVWVRPTVDEPSGITTVLVHAFPYRDDAKNPVIGFAVIRIRPA